jgi:hypothetical protein
MGTSRAEGRPPSAVGVRVRSDAVIVDLGDGRTITAPLTWYPRLLHASVGERRNWRLMGGGSGIHWPDLDEDLSVEGILAGRPSTESQASLQRWLTRRKALANKRMQPARGNPSAHRGRRGARG